MSMSLINILGAAGYGPSLHNRQLHAHGGLWAPHTTEPALGFTAGYPWPTGTDVYRPINKHLVECFAKQSLMWSSNADVGSSSNMNAGS